VYVFVGTPKMIKAGRPFVLADGSTVTKDGTGALDFNRARAIRFRTSKRGKRFRTRRGDEYLVHAWAEVRG